MILCNLPSSRPTRWAYTFIFFSNTIPNPPVSAVLSSEPPQIPARSFGCRCRRGGSSRDPNAESVRGGRFRFRDDANDGDVGGGFGRGGRRRWWSDNSSDKFEEEFDLVDDEDDRGDQLWDKIWIFKVFRSYGYLLPAIIASMLLATGPKAFLLALALPLGQSAISLAMNKLWGGGEKEVWPSHSTQRKPSSSSSDFSKEGNEKGSDNFQRMASYETWVSDNSKDDYENVRKSEKPSYGGWDELNQQRATRGRQKSRTERSTSSAQVKMGKLSKKGRYRDSPLILRLLVAVFPLLGSWFRIL